MAGPKAGPPTGGGDEKKKYSWGQYARWLLALAVAVAAAAYLLCGARHQTLCHGALAAGEVKVLKVCGAPGLTQLLPFLLVIAVLLAPDLTELAIPGVLSLKRKVDEQDVRQQRIEAELVRVDQRVEQRVAQNQSNDIRIELRMASERLDQDTVTFHDVRTGPRPRPTEDSPEEDGGPEEEVDGGTAAPEPSPRPKDGGGSGERQEDLDDGAHDRESLTLQLLYLAKNIEQYETISRMREVDPDERMAALTEDQQERVDRWHSVFGSEINLVLRVRNQVAHQPYSVGIEELREADQVGRKLLRILLGGLGLSTEPIDRFDEA